MTAPPGGVLLAVYGSLRPGARAPDAPPAAGVRHLRPCVVPGRLYDLGPYPGLVADPAGRVAGDLLAVDDPVALAVLDGYEDFDPAEPVASLYVRRRLRLVEPDVDAWVYVYNRSVAGRDEVADGNWAAYLATREP